MPELPDVEGFRRYFNRFAAGERVERVEVLDRSMLRNTSPQGFGRALRGRSLEEATRRGKWLLAPAGGRVVLMHFGMTGLLHWTGEESAELHRHDRVAFHLPGGVLAYRNMRKLGGIWLAREGQDPEEITGPLGPDAARIGRDQLAHLAASRGGGIKSLLMDQGAVAGSGNLLTDETLWRARIEPRRSAAGLSRAELDRLHESLREVVRDSSRHGRIPRKEGWLTAVRDEKGAECPRCGRSLRRATVAGRTTCWCPRCQPRRR
ncbi:MAG TPA: DNA-formamidopyrimidine glycosylase family protein [Thermoleophilaceae bacterium]|nr:DNA-formamidopyrimidine glycosylase family protein [Thermoleophilaceae bacterium]